MLNIDILQPILAANFATLYMAGLIFIVGGGQMMMHCIPPLLTIGNPSNKCSWRSAGVADFKSENFGQHISANILGNWLTLKLYCWNYKSFYWVVVIVYEKYFTIIIRAIFLCIFWQKLSSIKGRLPSKVFFHQWLASIKGFLTSKVIFHQSSKNKKLDSKLAH